MAALTLVSIKEMIRLDNWWYTKIPPLLAVAYLQILLCDMGIDQALLLVAALFFSIACVASYGHVINDIFDVAPDRRAGRRNAMARLKPGRQALICITLAGAGFLPSLFVDYSAWRRLLLFLNYLWPTIYSLPPLRLKERGLWGILCDAAGAHVTPTLFLLTVFAQHSASPASGQTAFTLMMVLWSCVLGIKGILYHQVADRENDMATATHTFVTAACPDRLERLLPRYNLGVELPASAVLVLALFQFCPLASLGFCIHVFAELAKNRLGIQFVLNSNPRNTRPSIPFVNDFFCEIWLPLAAALQLALRDPAWLWLLVAHLVLFQRLLRIQARDLRTSFRQAFGTLHVWRRSWLRRQQR